MRLQTDQGKVNSELTLKAVEPVAAERAGSTVQYKERRKKFQFGQRFQNQQGIHLVKKRKERKTFYNPLKDSIKTLGGFLEKRLPSCDTGECSANGRHCEERVKANRIRRRGGKIMNQLATPEVVTV